MSSALKICPVCSTEYPANERFCPRDGSALRAQGGSSADLVGSIIAERYHVIKKLGEGGMGQVYLAEHVKMGRKSAVKVMNPGMVDNVDAISRFNREAANASRINHPNVAGIYDFGETPDGLIYMAMEFVEGEPLTDIIKAHGALTPMRASEISRQAAEGLSVAHDMGIVHRDLKPDNIMIGKGRAGSDLVKVVDFGIAKAAASDNQKVTKTGMVVGTPEYMSPEQLSGDPLDARSDIYSLGLVTFAMLTGKLPFPSDSMQETMIMRLTDKPKGLGEMKPDMQWPDDVQAVMDKVLERDANKRYRSASDYARDLVEAIERMPASRAATHATHIVSAVNQADAAAALTAATMAMPKTRVSAKRDVSGRTAEDLARAAGHGEADAPALRAGGGSKSRIPMFAGAGVVIAAVVVAALVMKGTYHTGAQPTDSPPLGAPASPERTPKTTSAGSSNTPPTQTGTPVNQPRAGSGSASNDGSAAVYADLDLLNTRAEKDLTPTDAGLLIGKIQAMSSRLKTADQRVYAAVIESLVQGVLDPTNKKSCDALQKVEKEARGTRHESEFNAALNTCKSPE